MDDKWKMVQNVNTHMGWWRMGTWLMRGVIVLSRCHLEQAAAAAVATAIHIKMVAIQICVQSNILIWCRQYQELSGFTEHMWLDFKTRTQYSCAMIKWNKKPKFVWILYRWCSFLVLTLTPAHCGDTTTRFHDNNHPSLTSSCWEYSTVDFFFCISL